MTFRRIPVPTGPCHPKGKDRGRRVTFLHDLCDDRIAVPIAGTSLNHRPVIRCVDVNGVLQTYRVFGRKGLKLNRLPRGSKRRTGVVNGQCVADMVSR